MSALCVHIQASLLRDALSDILPIIPSRTPVQALECVRLTATEDVLDITATDLDVSISYRIPIEVKSPGSVLLPAKLLAEFVRSLPKEETLRLECRDAKATLETSYGRYQLSGLPPEDFPTLEEIPPSILELEPQVIKGVLHSVLFAASRDSLRPALTGVLFEILPGEFRAVATDSYRLSRLRVLVETDASGSLLVPATSLKLLRHFNDPVALGWNSTMISFRWGTSPSITVSGRLIAERFPNYEQVIPPASSKRFVCARETLLDALERVSIFSSAQLRIVRLHFTADGLTLESENEERGDRAQEFVAGTYTGEEFSIGFNAQYLTDALKAVDAPEVLLEFTEPNKPVALRRADEAEIPLAEAGLFVLVMPVRL